MRAGSRSGTEHYFEVRKSFLRRLRLEDLIRVSRTGLIKSFVEDISASFGPESS